MDREFTYLNDVITPDVAVRLSMVGLDQTLSLFYWKGFIGKDDEEAFGLFESLGGNMAPEFKAGDRRLKEWMAEGFDPETEEGSFFAAYSTAQMLQVADGGIHLFEETEVGFKVPGIERNFRYYEMAEAAAEFVYQQITEEELPITLANQRLRIYSDDYVVMD